MSAPFYDDSDTQMCIYRNTVDFPVFPRPQCQPCPSGLYLQSTRPPSGTTERIFPGDALPLETTRLNWGKGVGWDNETHRLFFTRQGVYSVQWIIPVSAEPNRPVLVDLVDSSGNVLGQSACRFGVLEGCCAVHAERGMRLRLINRSASPINLTSIGNAGNGVAGTLMVWQVYPS